MTEATFDSGSAAPAMRRVVVTGADGLIGWHLRAFWNGMDDVEVLAVDRHRFADRAALAEDLARADAVVHLGGLNRGADQELEATNIGLAQTLVELCQAADLRPHVLFSSSTHRHLDTAYGRSKRRCAEIFEDWSCNGGGRFTELVLPNVYGEHGRPFHNSAVSTFCHQLAHGETPTLLQDQELEWLHAQEVAEIVDDRLRSDCLRNDSTRQTSMDNIAGHSMRVSHLLDTLKSFDADYRAGIVPSLADGTYRDLFNTYRSYLFPQFFPVHPTLHEDPRGRLFESVKVRSGGQCFLSTTVPGVIRGGHYHRRKFERFLVVEGRARIRVRRVLTDTVEEFEVEGSQPSFVDMPTLHTHDLENIGDGPLVTLFWADEIFDPESPDTYFEPVLGETSSPR